MESSCALVQKLCAALKNVSGIEWYCVLSSITPAKDNTDYNVINITWLDGWVYDIHACLTAVARVETAFSRLKLQKKKKKSYLTQTFMIKSTTALLI